MKILMTGGTGLIGKELGKALVRAGHEIAVISRNKDKASKDIPYPCSVIEADLQQREIPGNLLNEIQVVIHLAGENVGQGRWSQKRKDSILKSRSQLTKNLIQSLKNSKNLKTFISASAVGLYGSRGDEILTENSLPGDGFLAEVCKQWEESLVGLDFGIRKVIFRTGVVLSPWGGALEKMLLPFRLHMGGALGSGRQWVSWIHIDDMVNLYVQAVNDLSFAGIYNAVSPNPVTNLALTQGIAENLGQRLGPKAPAIALKLALGEMSRIVLDSQRVLPQKLQEKKYSFAYSEISQALQDCLKLYKDGNSVLHTEQYLPVKRQDIFPFFADANNLEELTPEILHFKIEKVSTSKVQKGTLIDYKLKIRGVPAKWKTEIQEWIPDKKFVDFQLKGPYSLWHHTHLFEDLGPGTLMTDTVLYRLPLGMMGWLAAGKLVQSDIGKIFSYRREKVHQIILTRYGGKNIQS
jgi:uncharacterized protein (TIGR01777 family)